MNVLSLFDGISCGRLALERAGLKIDKYFTSEIDKYAIKVSEDNYSDLIRLGDVVNYQNWDIDWGNIDLLIGGSPCQGFSMAGKQLNFSDPRSKLFFVYVDIMEKINLERERVGKTPVKFLLENVKMKKEYLDIISDNLGVAPVFINSCLLSAQSRPRYYWFNWEIEMPIDKNIMLTDILESEVGIEFEIKNGQKRRLATSTDIPKKFSVINPDKAITMTARQYANWKGTFVTIGAIRGRKFDSEGKRSETQGLNIQTLEVKNENKSNCLTTVTKDNVITLLPPGNYKDAFNLYSDKFRTLTPIECERLQTLPDGYTKSVSNAQRYKMLGNGWTVDVIAHILSFLNFNNINTKSELLSWLI